jgi:drug/metabolite transporter (DMT)-like permease
MWALAVSVIWGGNVVAIRTGLDMLAPFWSAFWRMLLGVAVVAAYAAWTKIPLRSPPAERAGLIKLGVLFTAQIGLLNQGVAFTSPGFAVVLLNSHPVFANLAAHFSRTGERISGMRAVGLGLAMAGIAYVFLGTPESTLASNPLLGNLMILSSAILLGIRSVYTRGLVQKSDPVRAVVWQVGVSVPFFLAIAAMSEPPISGRLAWLPLAALVYQGPVIIGFCFIGWTTLLKRHPAGELSMFAFKVPLFGVVASHLLFGEALSWRLLWGVGMVTGGILLAAKR